MFGSRIASKDNRFLLPVASNLLSSDEQKHINRGSVRAWDITIAYGSAIYPIANGKVIYAGCNNAGGYGCWVMIDHLNGYKSILAHMINGSIRVKSGQMVKQNQIIGQVGWTGMTSFGPHTHLEIHSSNGRARIDQLFDKRLMVVCNLCNAPTNKPVVAKKTYNSTRQQITNRFQLNPVWLVVGLVLFILYLLYSPKNSFVSGAYIGSGFAFLTVGIAILPFIDLHGLQVDSKSTNFQQIHAIVQKWEGNQCTVDPVLTFAGITQGTYNRYRMEQGFSYQNVCSIRKQEIQDIYYRYYWLASGANQLPTKLAITYYDFAINAGVGTAKTALATCGMDTHCFNNYRVTYYKSLKYCSLYCNGWLNRVEDMRRYSE